MIEKKFDIEEWLIDFAVNNIYFIEILLKSKSSIHFHSQLLTSGTAPSLNYGVAKSTESKNDIVHKLFLIIRTKRIYLVLLVLFNIQCSNPTFKHCDELLGTCSGNQNGQYCLFGFKYGETPQFNSSGVNTIGPMEPGGIITYSFHTNITSIDTHSSNGIKTSDLDAKGKCAREGIKKALNEWERYGDFSFKKLADNSQSDIRFIVAEIEQGAIGWPNFQDELCDQVSGRIVLSNVAIKDCNKFFILSLHEIGHALGLGHISSKNIMSPAVLKYDFTGLQEGDIKGIQSIYGEQRN